MPEWQQGDVVRITHHAEAAWAVTSEDWDQVAALEPLHIYSPATVGDRFKWQGKRMAAGSIHVAMVRVRELAEPWEIAYEPSFGGCRSWVTLPEPPAGWQKSAKPVLDDQAFAELEQFLHALHLPVTR
jgi:hypothetical protein